MPIFDINFENEKEIENYSVEKQCVAKSSEILETKTNNNNNNKFRVGLGVFSQHSGLNSS